MVDVELYNHSPEWLAEEYEKYDEQEELYFFTPRYRKYPNGKRPDRAAGDGYRKATEADKEIESNKGITVGYKKTLVF
nr:isoform 2 of protein ataf2 [Quercus suber]